MYIKQQQQRQKQWEVCLVVQFVSRFYQQYAGPTECNIIAKWTLVSHRQGVNSKKITATNMR